MQVQGCLNMSKQIWNPNVFDESGTQATKVHKTTKIMHSQSLLNPTDDLMFCSILLAMKNLWLFDYWTSWLNWNLNYPMLLNMMFYPKLRLILTSWATFIPKWKVTQPEIHSRYAKWEIKANLTFLLISLLFYWCYLFILT